MDLRVRQMHNGYRIFSRDPDAVAHELDQVARHDLPRSLDTVLPSLTVALGLPPEAEVLVRHLRLRVRVLSEQVSSEELGAAWARAVVEALAGLLGAASVEGGVYVDERVAVFPDRLRARMRWLAERAVGGAPWWADPLYADGGTSEGAELWSLAAEAPWAAAELVRQLVVGGQAIALARWCTASEAERVWTEVVRGWRAEAVRQRTSVGTPHEAAVTLALGVGRAPVHPDGLGAEGQRALALLVGRAWTGLAGLPAWREALRAAPSPSHARLVLVAALSQQAPVALEHAGMSDWLRAWPAGGAERALSEVGADAGARGEGGAQVAGSSAGDEVPSPGGPDSAVRGAGSANGRGSSDRPASPRAAATASRGAEPRPAEVTRPAEATRPVAASRDELHPVKAGGLLHLVRRLVLDGVVEALAPHEVHDRLLALGLRAVDRLLVGLAPGARRAALSREAPVIAVFAGLPEAPSDLHELVLPTAWTAWADAWLLDVARRLPEELELDEEAARALRYGLPLDRVDPGELRLAALLCRAGRLAVGPTHAELHLPARYIQLPLRRGGWDIDPGWMPHLGRVVRVRYEVRR